MKAGSGRWTEISPSRFPHEREGLHFVRDNLPESEPYRAWSNFEFIASDGSQYEVDLLVLGPAGLHLVELKGWSGRISGNDYDWVEHNPGAGRPIPRRNELPLTRHKALELKNWLERAARRRSGAVNVPRVEESLFLHGPGVDARGLPENVRSMIFGRDDVSSPNGMRRIVVDRLGMAPRHGAPLGAPQRKALERLLDDIGLRPRPKVLRAGSWIIDDEPLGAGWGWLDSRAHHATFKDQTSRVRRWFVPEGSSASEAAVVRKAAEREYVQLRGLEHPGLVKPSEYLEVESAVAALVYPDAGSSEHLDGWVRRHESATVEVRLHVVRELAEVIRYAHGHGLAHRGLTPLSVSLADPDSLTPRVLVADWQAAGSATAESSTTTHHAQALIGHASSAEQVYAAPEVLRGVVTDRRLADVYSIGALAYLVMTGKAPADGEVEVRARLEADAGLMLSTDLDSPLESLENAIWTATSARVHDRMASVDDFLAALDVVLDDLTAPDDTVADVDPAEARPGDRLDNDFTVVRKLGEGSTSLVLLVRRPDDSTAVLKAARDDNKAERLREEALTLSTVPPTDLIARLLGPVVTIGGRTCLVLEQAGDGSLAAEIARVGRLNLDLLRRWGRDLLEAMAVLDGAGILHRDVKPANLGVRERSTDRKKHLVLFDFSLSAAPVSDLQAGTAHYRDPFLEQPSRRRYDQAAELFAVAVTLHEMASGRLPTWGDGRTDPAMLDDEVSIDQMLFDPSVAVDMGAFFATALARDSGERHDNVQEMATAWDQVFERAESSAPANGVAFAAVATLDTALESSGLSAKALSALERYELATVGDLLDVDALELSRIPGAAQPTKDEIRAAVTSWRDRLHRAAADGGTSVDAIIAQLLAGGPSEPTQQRVVAFMLGQGDDSTGSGPALWPTAHDVEAELDVERPVVDDAWRAFVSDVRKTGLLTALAAELTTDIDLLEGVASAGELAGRLIGRHGSHADEPRRSAQATALVRLSLETGDSGSFAVRRRSDVMMIAGGVIAEQADLDDVLEGAVSLAVPAELLALQSSLPTQVTCLESIRSAAASTAVGGLSDARILSVAAAASGSAAVSSRGEIYPRGMSAVRSLSLARGSLVSGGRSLSLRTVQARVRSRFPDATPLPGHPELDKLLHEAEVDLTWTGDYYESSALTSTVTRMPSSTMHAASAEGDLAVVDDTLRRSLTEAGFLAIAVSQSRTVAAQERLLTIQDVELVDLSRELLNVLRDDARTSGAEWQFVLRADALPDDDPTRRQLSAIVRTAAEKVFAEIDARTEPILLVGASILARFGCVDLLAPMADLARERPAARWLLAPQVTATSPDLDGTAVPVAASGQWLTVPTGWVAARPTAINE